MQMRTRHRPTIGIALSGGTLKAAAHVGVLAGLAELGIKPDRIAGTSAGALVAALHAHGYRHDDLLDLIRHFPGASLFDYGFPLCSSLCSLWSHHWPFHRRQAALRMPRGLLRGKRLERYFRGLFTGREAQLPYYVVATDLVSGQPIIYSNDETAYARERIAPVPDIAKVMLGSCCLPGLMTPVNVGGRLLVDGALRHYVPVDVLRQAGCEKIIAVNLHRLQSHWRPETFVHVLARSFEVLLQENAEEDVEGHDTLVLNPDLGHMSWVSFERMESCVTIGRNLVRGHSSAVLKLLSEDTKNPPTNGPLVRVNGT